MKNFLCLMAVIALSGCQSVSSPKSAVDAYLEALKKGEPQQQKEFSCDQENGVKSNEPLTNLEKWEITGQETATQQSDSDGKYELVSAKIETKALGGFSVARTWEISVWKSDDFFESRKRTIDKVNRITADSEKLVNRANALTGEKPVEHREPEMPNRSDYSSKPYCISRFASSEK